MKDYRGHVQIAKDSVVLACHGISHRIAPNGVSTELYFVRVLVRQGDRWLLAATQIASPSTPPKSSPQSK